jgi:hypothetical protein
MLFRSRLTDEDRLPWPRALGDELLLAANEVAAGRRTTAQAINTLIYSHDGYLEGQRVLRLRQERTAEEEEELAEARRHFARAAAAEEEELAEVRRHFARTAAAARARSPSHSPRRSARPRND